MASVKASRQGLVRIKQAIKQKGWKASRDRPLVEASKILEPQTYWHELGPYAYGCSRQTWERFLQRTPIRDRSFIAFCQILGVDPDEVAESVNCLKEDWGEAPLVEMVNIWRVVAMMKLLNFGMSKQENVASVFPTLQVK